MTQANRTFGRQPKKSELYSKLVIIYLQKSCFCHIRFLDKSVRPWMMPWLLLLHRHLFRRAWIRWTPFFIVLHWNTQPVFSESSVRWPESWWISALAVHCLPMHYSNSFTGFRLSVAYSLNSPPSLQGITYLSPGISRWPLATSSAHEVFALILGLTYYLDLALSAFQLHGSGTGWLKMTDMKMTNHQNCRTWKRRTK